MCPVWKTVLMAVSLLTVVATGANGQSAGMEVVKANQVARETSVVSAIAQGEKASRDDVNQGGLQGTLDEGDTDVEKDSDLLNALEESAFGDTDMYLVQKRNTGQEEDGSGRASTTYHVFEDNEFTKPLFTRTIEEYNVDFIIFSNPSFPRGTGHYIVLRRLEAQNDLHNYELEDDLNTEDHFDYETEMWMDTYDYYGQKQTSQEFPNSNTPKPPGQFQSGEENYADNVEQTGPKGESVDTGGGIPNKDEYTDEAPIKPRLPFKFKIKVPALKSSFRRSTNKDEVIYEAFSINFKPSLLGFLSDIDPLQYSFMNNEEDKIDALMEDDAGGEIPGEGEADSESAEYEEDLKEFKNEDKLVDLSKDKDFLIFQNNIKHDNGMQDIALEIIEKSSEEADLKPDTKKKPKRTKRDLNRANFGKKLHIIPSSRLKQRPESVKWRGCLRHLSVHNTFL